MLKNAGFSMLTSGTTTFIESFKSGGNTAGLLGARADDILVRRRPAVAVVVADRHEPRCRRRRAVVAGVGHAVAIAVRRVERGIHDEPESPIRLKYVGGRPTVAWRTGGMSTVSANKKLGASRLSR